MSRRIVENGRIKTMNRTQLLIALGLTTVTALGYFALTVGLPSTKDMSPLPPCGEDGLSSCTEDTIVPEEIPLPETATTTTTKEPTVTPAQPAASEPKNEDDSKTVLAINNQTVATMKMALVSPEGATINATLAKDIASRIETATTKFRTTHSLPTYIHDTALEASAVKYSTELLTGNYLSHTSKSGCDMACRFEANNYQAEAWGENLAMLKYSTEPSAEFIANHFMTQWQQSAGHRDNMLSKDFTHQGVGVTMKDGKVYVVVHFAKPF